MQLFILLLTFNLIGCVSHYHDQLQEELNLHTSEVMNHMQAGDINPNVAEQQIEDEWKAKRQLLAEYRVSTQKALNVFWRGVFTTLKIGMAVANSYVGAPPGLYKLGDIAIQSLHSEVTALPSPSLPPKTFTLPPGFEHLYAPLSHLKVKCLGSSDNCRLSHLEIPPDLPEPADQQDDNFEDQYP